MNVEANHPISDFSDLHLDYKFISEYLIHAPAEELKYYLIARSIANTNNNEIAILELARFFQKGILPIYEAFEYWREKNLVKIVEIDGTQQKNIESFSDFNNMKHYEKIKILFGAFPKKEEFDDEDEYEIELLPSVTQMLKMASNEDNDYEFSNFIARLEHLRKGKTLSYEAKRRLLYYKIKLGLSVDLIEFACNMSYENPHVKEYNHLNYARGILNNFYEANIFTLQDYYNRKRSNDYKIPTPEEIKKNTIHKKASTSYINNDKSKIQNWTKQKYTKEKSFYENTQNSSDASNKAMLKAKAQREQMREKAKKQSGYKEDFT